MNMIKQRNDTDCALAAIAMIAGVDYDDLWLSEFVEKVVKAKGCGPELTDEALAIAGFTNREHYISCYTWGLSSDHRRLLWGRKAILSVPSLNYERGYHAVAWDGFRVFDPSPKQVYQWLEQLQITNAVIFNENNT